MKFKGVLNATDIDKAVTLAGDELEKLGAGEKASIVGRLAIEEILLIFRENFGPEQPFKIFCLTGPGGVRVNVSVKGTSYNPLGEESPILKNLEDDFTVQPRWKYLLSQNNVLLVFPPANSLRKTIGFSWKYAFGCRKIFIIAITCQIFAALLGIVAPAISARIVVAYTTNELKRIIILAIILVVIQLLRNFFMVMSNLGYNKAYSSTLSALEKDLVENVLKVESECIDEKGSGMFIQRTTTDTQRIANGFNSIADMVGTIFNYAGVLIAMFMVDPYVALFVLGIIVVQCIMEYYRDKRLVADDRVFRKTNERVSGLVSEMVRGSKDVKCMNCEEQFVDKLNETILDANEKRWYMQKRSWTSKLFRWELGEFGSFILICLLVYNIFNGHFMATTAIVIFNYYTELGPNAVKVIGTFLDSLADFNLSNERVYALIKGPDFPKERFGKTDLPSVKGDVEFDHVHFFYERKTDHKVLNDLCFKVKSGEMVGLVGKSGCGKSTAFNLIPKLYVPTSGRVLIDGIDINELTKDSIRNNVTIVPQNPYIFRMSVRDNLKIVKDGITDEEMERVCRLACIDEDIKAMPDGYDTLIGEGGVKLSGGQRQRLAIARSMLKDSRIILFDEATSALDNETQAKIQNAIDNMRKERTVIIIAHRLSTIVNADRIMFMQDGKILKEGTHEELLRTCEPYQTFAAMDRSRNQEPELPE